MNELPFPMELNISSRPDEILIFVELESPVDKSGHELDVLLSTVKDFANLGNVGGLAGSSFPPDSSVLKVLNSQQVFAHGLEWSLEHHNIDPRAINVLAGMLHMFHVELARIKKAVITAPENMVRTRQGDESPSLYQPVPFALTDEREFDTSGLTIEVYLQEAQPESILAQAVDAFGYWFTAAGGGAFFSRTYTPDICSIYLEDAPFYEDDTLVFDIDEMIIDPMDSVNSLINVFQWVHANVAAVREVVLTEE